MASRRNHFSWMPVRASGHMTGVLTGVGLLAAVGLLLGPVAASSAAAGHGNWRAADGSLPPAPTSASHSTTTTTRGGTSTTAALPSTTLGAVSTATTLIGQALNSPYSATTNVPTNAPTCGGTPKVVDAAGTWTCSFDDEFQGAALDPTKWQVVTTQADGFRSGVYTCYVNSPNNISVSGGYLKLTVRKEASPFMCAANASGNYVTQYSGGDITSYQRFSQTYARVEFIAQVPAPTGPGTHSALWLYPESQKKYGSEPGEIDVAEMYTNYPNMAYPYLHYPYSQGTTNTQTDTNTVTANNCHVGPGFNDYVLEWTPTAITMIYNGQVCLIDHWMPTSPFAYPEPFNQPFFLNLTEGLANYTGAAGPNTPASATMEVKAVRVWQLAP